jgi:hypothetical protein
MFVEPAMTLAAVDRLVQQSTILEVKIVDIDRGGYLLQIDSIYNFLLPSDVLGTTSTAQQPQT